MRPGARICEVFAKSGTCRVGSACRFDHPEGMKAGEAMGFFGGKQRVAWLLVLFWVDVVVYYTKMIIVMFYVG